VLSFLGGSQGLVFLFGQFLFSSNLVQATFRLEEASVDLRLLGFTLVVSMLTGIAFGLWPALHRLEDH
jgi:hypothetical protein